MTDQTDDNDCLKPASVLNPDQASAGAGEGELGGVGPNSLTKPSWLSNVVEVQFDSAVRPDVSAADGAACQFVGEAEDAPLDELNIILREGGCYRAERAFDELPDDPAGELQPGVELPDLRGFYLLHLSDGADARAIAERLRNVSGVRHAAAVPKTKPACAGRVSLPDDDLLFPARGREYQWYVFRCAVERAWAQGFTGEGVVIADVDWGFRKEHPDLESRLNLRRAFNAIDGSCNVSAGSDLHHGTAVLGLCGAAADHKGLVGIAHGAELWPVQANVSPSEDPGAWGKALMWVMCRALEDEKKVVIILEGQSWCNGNITQICFVRAAILYAIALGAVVCVPAGNGNRPVNLADDGRTFEPVGLIVGATDVNDQPWVASEDEGSNYGAEVVAAAPGDPSHDLTCSDDLVKLYRADFGGTSGATAKVAGAVALMLQANRDLSHADAAAILSHSGTPVAGKPLGRLLNCGDAVWTARHFRACGS